MHNSVPGIVQESIFAVVLQARPLFMLLDNMVWSPDSILCLHAFCVSAQIRHSAAKARNSPAAAVNLHKCISLLAVCFQRELLSTLHFHKLLSILLLMSMSCYCLPCTFKPQTPYLHTSNVVLHSATYDHEHNHHSPVWLTSLPCLAM